MRLKSFHGASLTEAMRMVREALGEDAIIVATRDDENGGVRVTAAIDDVPVHAQIPSTSSPSATAKAMAVADVAAEDGSAALETIAEALTRHQLAPHLAERLMATATQFANDDPLLALGAALDTHFKFQPITDEKQDKPVILIGPPGAGKTLCIAKLATKAALAKRSVTVISTDTDRAGGMEQLAAFTRLLKLNLVEIEDPHALKDMISMQQGSQILVDTPGGNPFIDQDRKNLHALVAAAGGEAILTLPAGLDASEAVDMAHEFRALGATRLLLTRIDMVRRLGGMLRVAYDAHLPLAGFSASNKVVDAPTPFNPVTLGRLILPKKAGEEAVPHKKNRSLNEAAMTDPIPLKTDKTENPAPGLICRNMIAVASGKGGVGKTWFAITLCHALAKRGKRVLLFDGDLGLANVDIQLGLTPEKDLGAVAEGSSTLKDAVTKYPEGGFDILAGRSGSGTLATIATQKLSDLRNGLIMLARDYDYVVIDLGAGVDRSVRQMAGPAAMSYVVVTDEPTSLTDAYAFIKLARAANPNADMRVVVNMAASANEGQKTYETIRKACETFLGYVPTLTGIVRRDTKVREAIRAQTPLLIRSPASEAATDVDAIARGMLS